jgi:hypothetical protein
VVARRIKPQQFFERVRRARVALSLALLPPLAFFIFIVVWFHEGFILIPIACGIYLYMLAQFFIFQDPGLRSRSARRPGEDETT